MAPSFRTIDVDDVTLAYAVAGQGEPLLLIMGFGGTMDYWGFPFLSHLAKSFKVIAFDNRGVGESSLGTESPSISRFALDAAALLDRLGYPSAHVLGWSMGGYIAQELVLERPDLLRRLVLYGTCSDHRAALAARKEAFGELMDTSLSDQGRTEVALKMLFPTTWLQEHPGFAQAFVSRPMTVYSRCADGIAGQVEAIASWEGCTSRLGRINARTLVIAGEMDHVISPDLSRKTAELMPNGRYDSFPDGGHGLIYQYPKELAQMAAGFLGA